MEASPVSIVSIDLFIGRSVLVRVFQQVYKHLFPPCRCPRGSFSSLVSVSGTVRTTSRGAGKACCQEASTLLTRGIMGISAFFFFADGPAQAQQVFHEGNQPVLPGSACAADTVRILRRPKAPRPARS